MKRVGLVAKKKMEGFNNIRNSSESNLKKKIYSKTKKKSDCKFRAKNRMLTQI